MGTGETIANRRPLKSRSTGWAGLATRALLATPLTANHISLIGILFAAGAALTLVAAPDQPWFYLVAAMGIQLRLLANMLDGLVAVEGGRGSPSGAIFNEFPDRIEDSVLLVAAGYASLPWLGWGAALLAAVCAYVRLLGATLGQPQDFGGPMAKPHRMAALTIGCLAAMVEAWWLGSRHVLVITLAVIATGTMLTIARRLARIMRGLEQ